MRELSEEGFALRAMMPVKQGEKTPFSFTLGSATRIEGEGNILWIDEGGRVAGVQFAQISPEMKSKIDDWLIEEEQITDPRESVKQSAIAPASTMEELREEIRSTPVRGEASAHAVEEEAPVQGPAQHESQARIEEQPEAKVERPAVTGPKIDEIPEATADVKIAAEARAHEEIHQKEARQKEIPPAPPEPAVPIISPESEPNPQPASSVVEGLFRKWPKTPPVWRAVELPPLPGPAPTDAQPEPQPATPEDEQRDDRGGFSPPLPDISEILIQPHGLSSHDEIPPRHLADLPSAQHASGGTWEWFTLGRAVLTMVALTILVGMLVYHRSLGDMFIWLGETLGGASYGTQNAPAANATETNNTAPPGNGAELQSLPLTNTAPAPMISNIAPTGTPTIGNTAKNPPVPVTPLSSPEAGSDAGQSEYLQAEQLMRGRSPGGDATEAVRLLWVAVEKGNSNAELTLADLYWHGRGVVHNCDQARILLTAAARKGSSEAQKRLHQFLQAGCE